MNSIKIVDETINKKDENDDETPTIKKYNKSDLIRDSSDRFYKCCIFKLVYLTFLLNQSVHIQPSFFNDLQKFDRLDPKREHTEKKENGCV